jgi:DNA-binding LacI/PurR family transcriptional regulator
MAASAGEPVAVLDTAGDEWPPRSGHGSTVQLFRCACTTCAGYKVGKHVGLLGHRRIAFITPFADSRWSQNRADGLREGLQSVQPEGSVYVKACPIRDTLAPGAARPRPVLDRDIDRLMATGIVRSNPRAGLLRRSLESLRGEIRTEMHRQLLYDNLCAALDTVFEQRRTCWVCANDDVALQCLTYLKEAGVSVPERISLVGFDNTPEASMAGLTSYDFSYPALAHAMLDHILAPTGVRARQRRPVEVEGTLVVRGTTTRAATGHRAY